MFGKSASQGVIVSNTGTFAYFANESNDLPTYYPYNLPTGTKTIRVTVPDRNHRLHRIQWFNRSTHADKGYNTTCKLIDIYTPDQVAAFKYDLVYIIPVPTYDNFPAIDAIGLIFWGTVEDAAFEQEDFNGILVEFLGN
ncbi:MAG: hypothetical protein IKH57_07935 [Clostridia bacterium]|nr:hypothetical protein [Clostridia bacterium]